MTKKTDLSVPTSNHDLSGVLDRGAEFEGTLSFEGTFRIGGGFRGRVYTSDILIIGEGAKVEAEMEVGTLVLSGELSGTVRARDRVEIHKPAIFRGTIQTPSLKVDDGVIFEGVSQMSNLETTH